MTRTPINPRSTIAACTAAECPPCSSTRRLTRRRSRSPSGPPPWAFRAQPVPGEEQFTSLPGAVPGLITAVQAVDDAPRYHLDFETDDLDAETHRLIDLGAVERSRWLDCRILEVPGGHLVCVIPVHSEPEEFARAARRLALGVPMTDVIVFHHAQGLTEGVGAFADRLRAAGHQVTVPDLYDGQTFDNLDDGIGYARQIGFDTVMERGRVAAEDLPERDRLRRVLPWRTARPAAGPDPPRREGARCSSTPAYPRRSSGPIGPRASRFRSTPWRRIPLFVGDGDLDAAQALVAVDRRRGTVPLPRRPAPVRRPQPARVHRQRRRPAQPAGTAIPRAARDLTVAASGLLALRLPGPAVIVERCRSTDLPGWLTQGQMTTGAAGED